jgi:activator of HSP90 ATPase
MSTGEINASVFLKASPKEVYQLLMDEKLHSILTDGEVKMSDRPDGRFEIFGGYCHGYNIELVPGQRIVQAWHFDEDQWPRNHYSICTFEFEAQEGGCKMSFHQSDIPEATVEKLKKGWQSYYWEPMQSYFEA